ncbi:TonB-dependent receptor [Caulobacter sp. S45]|uniref:TonB-dependent receptor n=1 Tax=Caulobacter sp. S45 TaxID=1641861 RepID=UPI001C2D7811|nr:TonB-dependent receptor [Caulobacter sp. S45]
MTRGFTPATNEPAADANAVSEVVVTAQRLNAARQSIEPSLGASTYTINSAAIAAQPGGENQQLNQVILQLPGVVQDSFGQFHVRDDHNGIQYRLNGIILPEGISVFGQTLSPRLIDSLSLITGAMPAQYGLQTAGIIDISTKSGLENGGSVSIYGGSHGTYEPSFEYGGHDGETNFFVSGEFRRTQLGIESPDGTSTPDHDRADEGNLFVYVDHTLSAQDRVSFIGGYANDRFQIPDTPGLGPANGFAVGSTTDYPSQLLNETQREVTGFALGSYLHDGGSYTVQTSIFSRYSTLDFRPSPIGDLLYTGIAQDAFKRDVAIGVQSEGVYKLTPDHTVRGGVIIQGERGTSDTSSQVLPIGDDGTTGATPVTIIDNGGKTQYVYSLYLQDEWKILQNLILNYGARADDLNSYRDQKQLSPRVNLVWLPTPDTTLHAGYARYFNPPPFELVGTETVSKFQNTTGASTITTDTTPFAERQNYYDVGGQQRLLNRRLTLGVDVFYRKSNELIDEGQFGAPIILTPFNYQNGLIFGQEFTASYTQGPLSAYANFTHERAQGKSINSSQFSFDPADLVYISHNYIYLDHDQTYTGSAGASYLFREGVIGGTRAGFDLLYGSGLRRDQVLPDGSTVPNGAHVPDYVTVNLTLAHHFTLPYAGHVDVRFDVVNVADKEYEIRDGTGVGVGAPQFGARRGFFGGITKSF